MPKLSDPGSDRNVFIMILGRQFWLIQLHTHVLSLSVHLLLGCFCIRGLPLNFPSGSSTFTLEHFHLFLRQKFAMTCQTGTFLFPDAHYCFKTVCTDFD